ncbi:cytochrome C oxidase subunit IV family protein [Alteromonas sp. M12]|uniref:cytochrome C oxidase subunit IV family protein n=1 Tax=Alteromonas sp. M12 TaxID=3135644 RepID=UPI00319E9D56
MKTLLFSRYTFIWFILMAATIFTFVMGHDFATIDSKYAGISIFVITFVKVRYVILDFMEIREAPIVLRLLNESWLAITCILMIWMFYKGDLM